MENKTKVIILVVIAALLIVIGIALTFTIGKSSKQAEKNTIENAKKEAEEYVKKLNKILIEGGSKKELTDALYTTNILPSDIMTGPDMYLRQKPDDKISKGKNLEAYIKKANELAINVEKVVKDNFEYNIEGIVDGENYVSVLVSYKTYYFNAYINDLTQIQNELLIKAGYNLENKAETSTDQFKVDMYKARIKAATLLDNQLADYINQQETKKVYVEFTNRKPAKSSDSFISYLMNIKGYTYNQQGKFKSTDQVNEFIKDINEKEALSI